MFPMTDHARDFFRTQFELQAQMTEQMFDLQADAQKIMRTQLTKNMDAYNQAVDTGANATRAMFKAWNDAATAQLKTDAA